MPHRLPRPLLPIAALALCGAMACARGGAPAIAALDYSADVGANLIDANTFVARRDFVIDDLAGARVHESIPGLSDRVILRDLHVEPNGDVLFALDVGASLGGTFFRPADVIRFDGASFTREFDAAAAGVPANVHCDGVARRGDGGVLLLSFDRTFTAGGVTIRPSDVIRFANGAFGAKLVDARALGIPDTLNIDAVDTFRTRRYVLVSFDSGGTVGGVTFTASDLLQLDRTTGTWSKRFDLSTFSDRWQQANLDGVAAVNIDTIFENDLEQE